MWWARVTDHGSLIWYGVAAGAGLVVGLLVGLFRGDSVSLTLLRMLEGLLLAPAGSFLARAFISALLAAAGDSREGCLAVGWAFFLVPGAFDSIVLLFSGTPVFTAPILLTLATVIGGFVGMMDGAWRIHDLPLIWLTFPLDVTWGLAGSGLGCLLHVIDFAWGDHDPTPREGAHRYLSGFGIDPEYAFTQGSVRSNLPAGSGDQPQHEMVHVYSNRYFGPAFILTYLGWMVFFAVPAFVVGLVRGRALGTVYNWCYLNNPWEAWAYRYGIKRPASTVWHPVVFGVVAVLFFLGSAAGFIWVGLKVWGHN